MKLKKFHVGKKIYLDPKALFERGECKVTTRIMRSGRVLVITEIDQQNRIVKFKKL